MGARIRPGAGASRAADGASPGAAGGVGIADVARLAGVSTATVSRALRGLPHVSAATHDRVLEAAAALGYVATPSAAVLATGRTRAVAVVAPAPTGCFAQAVCGAGEVLAAAAYDVLLYHVATARDRRRFFERLPLRKRVDACLLVWLAPTGGEAARLRSLGIPVVLVGVAHDDFPHVRVDDAGGAARAVRHLARLGHERIGHIAVAGGRGLPAGGDRRAGYRRALALAGLATDPALEVSGPGTVGGGTRAMAELLARPSPPTAVVAGSDELALGAILAARRAGLRVPEDVSVVGFGDHELAAPMELTTVAQPVRRHGALAAALVLDAVERGEPAPPRRVPPARLVVRRSTAPPCGARDGRRAAGGRTGGSPG